MLVEGEQKVGHKQLARTLHVACTAKGPDIRA